MEIITYSLIPVNFSKEEIATLASASCILNELVMNMDEYNCTSFNITETGSTYKGQYCTTKTDINKLSDVTEALSKLANNVQTSISFT